MVRYVLVDGKFEKVKPLLLDVVSNITTAKEHVAEIERRNLICKRQNKGAVATLLSSYLPRRIKIELVYFVIFLPNAFPANPGVYRQYYPCQVILRKS